MPLSKWFKKKFKEIQSEADAMQLASDIAKGVYDEEILPNIEELFLKVGTKFIPVILGRFNKTISKELLNKYLKDVLERYCELYNRDDDLHQNFFKAVMSLLHYGADISLSPQNNKQKTFLLLLLKYTQNDTIKYKFIRQLISYLKTSTIDYKFFLTNSLITYLDSLTELVDDNFVMIILLLQAGANPKSETLVDKTMTMSLGMRITELIHKSAKPHLFEKYLPALLRSGCDISDDFERALGYTRFDLSSINLNLALLQCGRNADNKSKYRLLLAIHRVMPKMKKYWATFGIPRHLNGDAPYIFERVNVDTLRLELQAEARMNNRINQFALFCICLIEERRNQRHLKSKLSVLPLDLLIAIMDQLHPTLDVLMKSLTSEYAQVREQISQRSGLIIYQRKSVDKLEPRFNFFLSATSFSRHYKSTSLPQESESKEQEHFRKAKAVTIFNSHLQIFKSVAEVVTLVDDIRSQPAYAGVDLNDIVTHTM